MEITLEAIISLIGLFVGGGAGAFFTWRYQRKKAKAEAESAEIDAAKEMQGLYKQMLADANEYLEDARNKVDGLRQERDHYKQDRDEQRKEIEKLTKLYYEIKTDGERERSRLKVDISRVQNQLKGIIPFTCTVPDCKLRRMMETAELPTSQEQEATKQDIEPTNEEL